MREPPEFPYEATGLATNILRKHDEALREEILQNLILPNRALLRNGNRNRVGQEGWYTAFCFDEFPDLAQPSTFPVPPDSFGWYGLETDSRDGLPFRFFSGSAWLSLPPPQRQCNLRFIIPHVLMGEALPEVTLSVSGNPIPLDTTERDSFGRPIGIGSISPSTWKFLGKSLSVRVEFSCKYSALPKHLYADATDARKLSIAVSYPQYVDN